MKKDKRKQKFTFRMRRKLSVLFVVIMLMFAVLSARLVTITKDNGSEYEKQVLSQQQYDSETLPYRRGSILDKNGTVLAVSEKVYSVILDVKQLLETPKAVDPTVTALVKQFGLDETAIRTYIKDNPDSAYDILAKELPYEDISNFEALMDTSSDKYNKNIKGVWFEASYKRKYPNGSMASDVIGFTTTDNQGQYGLEEYYDDILNGTEGREYGYLDDNSELERTTIAAEDGDSIVTTIDGNIQSIVEKYLQEFNDEYKDSYHEGNAAENVGAIVMDVDTGEILAMASYPNFDLNDVYNTDALLGGRMVDTEGKKVDTAAETGGYINATNLAAMSDDQVLANLNSMWKNFCISSTYEPGSVAKPFTVAAALDSGSITGNEVYKCTGSLDVGGYKISCHNVYGDGDVSVERAIEISCNVALMQIGQAMGAEVFSKYQHAFGFGLKTNIDLDGEARTANLVYGAEDLGPTELATGTFGQGFNVTMIETIAGFCSLINGGYYYQPHVVSEIESPSGATVEKIQPRLVRQTVSESTSAKILEYCDQVVAGEEGTGKTARPAGYMIGGKTGTAETIPRDKTNYVVSFMGYAPADDPQIAIYVVVDRPNAQYQADAKFATKIVRNVLTEVLPYLHYPMTEELTDDEKAELAEREAAMSASAASSASSADGSSQIQDGNEVIANSASAGSNSSAVTGASAVPLDEANTGGTNVWESFDVDPETGYYIDPDTGALIDPDTGMQMSGASTALPEDVAGEGQSAAAGEGD